MIRQYFIPLAERTLYRFIASGEFPKADIRIGEKVRFWRRETVEAWTINRAGCNGDLLNISIQLQK